MISGEFREWLRYHMAAFVGFSDWLDRLPEFSPDGLKPTQADVLRRWNHTLRECELADAKAATDALHSGEEAEPKGWDRHPAAVRAIATRLARQRRDRSALVYVDWDVAVRCLACQDTGYVQCWNPKSMEAAHPNTLYAAQEARSRGEHGPRVLGEPFTLYTCAVPCTCEAGDGPAKYQDCRYDDRLWLLVSYPSDPAEQHQLLEWMASRDLQPV